MWQFKSLKIVNIISFKNQEFLFRNGRAYLIIGKNLTDPGQPRNGSGKSSLIESIALAVDGKSIRDVKTKELINNEAKDGSVQLEAYNSQLNQTLTIRRKIFANTTSAEYQAWINGEDQCALYSDFNSFNAWIWKTLGISREDFFSFYLITSDSYDPFLSVSDTKKKEIINRFSGADKVDVVFDEIDNDSQDVNIEISRIEKGLLTNTTKQELLSEQLIEAEREISDEEKNKNIEQKKLELDELNLNPLIDHEIVKEFENAVDVAKNNLIEYNNKVEDILQPLKDQVELKELELEVWEFSEDFESKILERKNKKIAINGSITENNKELPKVKEQFRDEISLIEKEETDLKESIKQNEADLKEFEKFISDVNKQLLDSITCPKCSHVFNLKDKEFNAEEAKAALPDAEENVTTIKALLIVLKNSLNVGIQAKKTVINEKVIKAGEGIKNKIEEFNKQLISIGAEEVDINKKMQKELEEKGVIERELTTAKNNLKSKQEEIDLNIQTLNNAIKRAELNLKQKQNELSNYLQSIKSLEDQIVRIQMEDVDRSKIDKITIDIEKLLVEEISINEKLEEYRKKKESIDAWGINFKLFKSHLANKSIKNIEDFTNLYLQNMGSNLQISIEGYKTLSNKKLKEQITTSVLRDGFDAGSYGKFSGGERGRISISVIMSIQELINLNSKYGGLDFLCCDEILDQVDGEGLDSIIRSLQAINRTIMIVSQNEVNAGEHTLIIQKENKISTILN